MNNNAIYLHLKKSNRKNAKTSNIIPLLQLISKDEKINDTHILNYFIDRLNYCISELNELKTRNIIFSYNICIDKTPDKIFNHSEYKQVFSIEKFINELYYMFYLIYPYNNISLYDIFNNQSVKYIINKWYNEEV